MNLRSHKDKELAPALDNINKLNRKPRKKLVQQTSMEEANQNQNPANQAANGNLPPNNREGVINANDEPNNYDNRQGIAPPPINRQDFDIKNSLLQPIQKNLFHGYADENPIKHLQKFERICDLTKTAGISEDAFKLRLFPFSLAEPASEWENEMEPGSITTWDQCKSAFLDKFYTANKTGNYRTEISSFEQMPLETFSEAWLRFKKYLSDCPHHNFQKDTLLSTFYRGLVPEDKKALNSSSGGNFLMCTVTEGMAVIDRLSKADAGSHPDYDRKKQLIGNANKEIGIKALNDKLDKLLSERRKNFEVNMIGEGSDVQTEEVAYIQNNYRQNQPFNNFKNNNLSYRSTNVANPEDQHYPQQKQPFQQKPYVARQPFQQQYQQPPQLPYQPQPHYQPPNQQFQPPPTQPDNTALLNQLLKATTAQTEEISAIRNEFNKKLDNSHMDLCGKFEQLNSRMMHIESNQASASNAKYPGQLPGKAIQNPREYNVSTFTLMWKKEETQVRNEDVITGDSNVEKGEAEIVTEISEVVDAEKEIKELDIAEIVTEKSEVSEAEKEEIVVDTASRLTGNSQPKQKKPTSFQTWIKRGSQDVYKTLLPRQLQVRQQMAPLVMEKPKGSTSVHLMSTVDKLDDPGTFTLPCSINGKIFTKCLCDLGASISMMPFSVANHLGLTSYEPTKVSLVLADRSVMTPRGIIENVPVRIGKVTIPTDFVVVNMEEEPSDPLILGRPFLASAGTLIDVKHGYIKLILGKHERLTFDLNGVESKPRIKGQTFSVKEVDEIGSPDEKPISNVKPRKEKELSDKLIFELEPNGQVNGVMEYKVKGGRPPKPYEIASFHMAGFKRTLPPPGPFTIREIKPNGSIILSGLDFSKLPFNGQKVKLYVANSETEIRALNLGPEYEVKPTVVVDGALEYSIRGIRIPNPFSKIKQLLKRAMPEQDWSTPFAIKEVHGKIVLISLKGTIPSREKQKIQVYLVTENAKEDTTVPLSSEST